MSRILPTSSKITEQHVPCTACGSSDARCNYDDGHGYCFSCQHYFPSDKEFNPISSETFTYEYLPWRNVSKETFATYSSKTKVGADGKPILIGFEYPNGSFKTRKLEGPKKDAWGSKGDIAKAGLFGRNRFDHGSHKYVTITEGELDALSLHQVLRSPVVSVRSSVTAQSDCAIDRSWLNAFERIYIAFDADEPGRIAAASVAKLFDYNKVYNVKFRGGNRKDANDYLRAGEGDELRQLWWNSKKFLPETIVSSFSDFDKILSEKPKDGTPYPFPTLNYMTYGMRTSESVLWTAQEGVGKTELMHAIEHQLLTETSDAIGAIYLEEPKKRHLQAIAGIQLRRPVHLPDCNTSDDEVRSALQQVVGEDDRLHLYSHFGSDDPDSILDTIRFLVAARLCRWIILDHITMVVSGIGGENERRALDYLSTRLEMMVKELDFGLHLVSHVNDDGLTRGSRNISKIADIRIDATRDLTSSDPVIRNTTRLMVSKNRFCGRTGPAGDLLFDPVSYTLSEYTGVPANDNEENSRSKDNRLIEAMAA